jgi:hypothetical protein
MNKTKPGKLQKDIAVICDYLELDENRHYEESGRPKDHIWLYVKRIQRWLNKNNKATL